MKNSNKILIVAEIGCNHCGKFELAKEMILKAKECGVDCVKFQVFNSNLLISKFAEKADYQKKTTGTKENQLEMTKKLELSHNDYLKLYDYAISLGLEVIITPFDMESIDFLEKINQRIWKIPSGEITNLPYLEKIASINIKDKIIILSTGMATIKEIKTAINILEQKHKNKIIILHCNTEYPTPDEDVNVSAILDLKKNFPEYEIGFSDHSKGYLAATLSASYGISLIEKHFTLSKKLPGPDHKASANPKELKCLVNNVRRAEILLGNNKKYITASEQKNINIARKSIVASKNITIGEIFTEKNITCKRPGNGISPMKWYDILGKKATKNYLEDELIDELY